MVGFFGSLKTNFKFYVVIVDIKNQSEKHRDCKLLSKVTQMYSINMSSFQKYSRRLVSPDWDLSISYKKKSYQNANETITDHQLCYSLVQVLGHVGGTFNPNIDSLIPVLVKSTSSLHIIRSYIPHVSIIVSSESSMSSSWICLF